MRTRPARAPRGADTIDQTTAMPRAVSRALPWLALALVAAELVVLRTQRSFFIDFDVQYFGGLVERDGSFSETARVVALAAEAGSPVDPVGVAGSPTLIALVFQPLSWLSLDTARWVWFGAYLIAIPLAVRSAAPRWWPAWTVVLLASTATLLALTVGQVSVFVSLAIIASYGALRDGRDVRTGVLLGLAAAFRLYPAFLALALVAHRRWRALGWMVAVAVGLTLAGLPALGFGDVVDGYRATLDVGGRIADSPDNQSLPGLLLRATGSLGAARALNVVLLAAGAALVLAWPRRSARPEHTFVLAVAAMFLAQGLTWSHYLPALLVVPLLLADEQPLPAASRRTWGFAIAASVLVALSALVEMPGVDPGDLTGPLSVVNLFGTAGLVLYAAALTYGFQTSQTSGRLAWFP